MNYITLISALGMSTVSIRPVDLVSFKTLSSYITFFCQVSKNDTNVTKVCYSLKVFNCKYS